MVKRKKKNLIHLLQLIKTLPIHKSDLLALLLYTKTIPVGHLYYNPSDLSTMISTDFYSTLRNNTYKLINDRVPNERIRYNEIIRMHYPTFNDALDEIPFLVQVYAFLHRKNKLLEYLKIVKGNICKDGFYFLANVASKTIRFKYPYKLERNDDLCNYVKRIDEINLDEKKREIKKRVSMKETVYTNVFDFKRIKVEKNENDESIIAEFIRGRKILKHILPFYDALIDNLVKIFNPIKKEGIFHNIIFKIESEYYEVYAMIILSNGGMINDEEYNYIIKDSFNNINSDKINIHPQFLFDSINNNELQEITKYMGTDLPEQINVFNTENEKYVYSVDEQYILKEKDYF
ncbi:hypothetical protein H311_02738 [Anncaliia algerae PRA109]|nr:hypothetical protein H311_02738 [Anncaliia algerae PRA109]